MKKFVFEVSYIIDNDIRSKTFDNVDEALTAYDKIKAFNADMPRRLQSNCGIVNVMLRAHNWSVKEYDLEDKALWRKDAKERLLQTKLNKPQIEAVMSMPVGELRNAVVARNIDKITELKGIGVLTAKRVIFALKSICVAETVKSVASAEFLRASLNSPVLGSDVDESAGDLIIDTIRKTVSPMEAKAMALGGKDAVLHVVSYIEEPADDDLDARAWADMLLEKWRSYVHDGIVINDVIYVPYGHGPNAAKMCHSIWVKKSIFEEMDIWRRCKTEASWKTTVAKKLGYMVGLQATPRKACGIPFKPEDFVILPSVIDVMVKDVTKLFLDGHEENLDNFGVEVNRTDGYGMIEVPDEMIPELYNRMLLRGDDPEEADERLQTFLAKTSVDSWRAEGENPVAMKGCFDRRIHWHQFLVDNGVTTTLDGRPLNTIVGLLDETVVKTNIGEGCAYKTFADWCKAVGEYVDLGVCVKAHKKSLKNVPYQVVQSLCEASDETVAAMAAPTTERVNGMHTVEGASKALGREIGTVLKAFPALANVRDVKERIRTALERNIDDAFGGRLLKAAYYAFITPDPIYALQGWFGLERTGCLNEGEFSVGQVGLGELATWRSPTVHPNSVRVVNNVKIPVEYAKYFKADEFVITMNSKDDISMAADADWDGDHMCVSKEQSLIQAAKETLAQWPRLIVWETPKTQKKPIIREDELEYFCNLTKRNELGLMVYGLNALLNRIVKRKDQTTGEIYHEIIPVSHRGVNFKKFASNVLVDASKHGGAEIDEPEESAQCRFMLQPWAKEYRDEAHAKLDLSKGYDRARIEKRAKLDKLAKRIELKDPRFQAGTLNKLYALYAEAIDRSLELTDAPAEEFDFHKIMFKVEERDSYRGLSGLIRKGEMPVVRVGEDTFRPDQGLFDSLARRIERDRAIWSSEDHKDKEDNSFSETWRVNALAEIQAFAEGLGRTLEDAYDVVTWQMFKYIDKVYATTDNKLDFIRDNLWKAYWMIFGGMAAEAAQLNSGVSEDDSDDVDEIFDVEGDDFEI